MKHLDKKSIIRPIAVALCTAVAVGSAVTAIAVTSNKKAEDKQSENKTATQTAADLTDKLSKDETVYVIAGADGSVEKIIVSDWIKNSIKSASINDKSELKNAENVKGNEKYTMSSDSMRVWDAQGNDIYYKGNIDKELPVKLSVSYKLDGKTVDPKTLAGKSGKVTIRYEYTNNQYETVDIDGKQEKIYVPFAMLTGMLLDNDVFTNINVTNGKIINDGDRTVVAGIAFPGLQSNLAISKDKLDIPDYVEITADVKKFKMSNTVTIAANNIFNEIDTSKINSVSDLEGQLDKVTSSMKQLTDGSSTLYGGLTTLLNKSSELISGINKLSDGAKQLQAGATQLDSGLNQLTENNASLNAGAEQVFTTLLDSAYSTVTSKGITIESLTIANYKTVLTNIVANPTDTQKAELITIADATLNAKLAQLNVPAAYYDAAKYMLYEQFAVNPQITQEQAIAAVAANMQDPQKVGQAAVEAAKPEGQLAIKGLCLTLAKAAVKPEIDTAVAKLDSYNEFYKGIGDYTDGVTAAAAGANALKAGIDELANGILTLKNGTPTLVNGITELKNGAGKLNDGLNQFNEQGIKKITDLANGDLRTLVVRAKATVDVSKNYKSFSGISDDMDGSVKFIYKTDSIKVDKK